MIKRYDYSPILGWSISRYDTFSICRRKYYYSYYGKHDREHLFGRIKRLKELTAIPMETGKVFHDMIATLLRRLQKTDRELDRARFFDYARGLTREACTTREFAEVYFGELSAVDPDPMYENVRMALENFLGSSRFRWILDEAIIYSDDWIIEPEGYGETRIDGIKAYCNVDFLVPMEDMLYIIDWKAGKPDERKYGRQLLAYSTGAAGLFDVEPGRIVPLIAYTMPQYAEQQIEVGESDIAGFVETVRAETAEMRSYCADIDENIPLGKQEFPLTQHLKLCGYCQFRELCGRS